MKSASLLLAGTLGLCVALQVQAGTFFVDDFGDEPASFMDDGERVNWGTGFAGKKDRGGGNLVLTVLPGSPFSSAFVPVDPYEDISLRTQFRMEDAGIDNAGVTARISAAKLYYGSITPTGTLQMRRLASGQFELLGETVFAGIDATTTDVNMQLDAMDDLLSLTVWPEGSPRPDAPQLSVEDSTFASGDKVGVWMRGGTEKSIVYDFFEAADRPWDPLAVVIPNAYEYVDGESADNPDFFGDDNRWQHLLPASQFASVPDTHRLISKIVGRPDKDVIAPWTFRYDHTQTKLSTTSKGVGELSNTFADNTGPDETIVFEGELELSGSGTGPSEGPRDAYEVQDFQVYFPYDPSQGNLLLEFTTMSGSDKSSRADLFDSTAAYGGNSWVWTSDPSSEEASNRWGTGLVWEVTFVSADCNGDGLTNLKDANCATPASIDGTLALAGLLPGDLDGNRTVGFADFLVLSANFGTSGEYTDGDLDKTGDIGFADFVILSSNYGQSSAPVANVPEPAAGAVLACGIILCWSVSRLRPPE